MVGIGALGYGGSTTWSFRLVRRMSIRPSFIHVRTRRSHADSWGVEKKDPALSMSFTKVFVTLILKQQAGRSLQRVPDPIGNANIQFSVVVEIDKIPPPADIRRRSVQDSGSRNTVIKKAVAGIDIQRRFTQSASPTNPENHRRYSHRLLLPSTQLRPPN